MADMDDELESLFDESSFDDKDMDDFLKMMDGDDSSDDIFSDDDESSFLSPDSDAEDSEDLFRVMDDVQNSEKPASGKNNASNNKDLSVKSDDSEGSFTEFDDLFADVSDEDESVPELLPKKSLWQKIKSIFKPELTEEQIKEKEAEQAEETEYEERIAAQKEEKKKVKSEAKAAAKEEANVKKQAKKEAKKNQAAAKKADAAKKKQEKAAKKAEKAGGPIPKSQLVPVKPLIVLIILGIAISVVVILGSDTKFYTSSVKEAKEFFIHQKYDKAYQSMLGLDIKEKDQKLYDQVTVVNLVDNKLQNYYSYIEIGKYEEALDSLLGGIRKYNENVGRAEELGLINEFQSIYDEITAELQNRFGMGVDSANSILAMTQSEYSNNVKSIANDAAVRDGVLDAAEVADNESN